jgi:hypothetical protein
MVGRSRKNIPVSKVVPVIILNYRKKYYSLPQTLSTADERCESNAARAKKQAQSYCPFMFTVFVEICRSTTELLQENLPEIDKARGPVFHLLLTQVSDLVLLVDITRNPKRISVFVCLLIQGNQMYFNEKMY